jgi:hypothetical protein
MKYLTILLMLILFSCERSEKCITTYNGMKAKHDAIMSREAEFDLGFLRKFAEIGILYERGYSNCHIMYLETDEYAAIELRVQTDLILLERGGK